LTIKHRSSSPVLNGNRGFESFANGGDSEAQQIILTGSPLKTQTLYESSYYPPSFEFPYNPDSLVRGNDYSTYDEMRHDDQIKSCLIVKKNFVLSNGWDIQCEDNEIKKEIKNSLLSISSNSGLDTSFDDILFEMLSAYDYGFSLSEPVYQIRNGKIEFKTIKTRPPHSFLFKIAKNGDVESIVQMTSEGEKVFKPSLFLHHVNLPEFGNPYGISDLKSAHIAWKAKKFINKFLNIYLERFASPTIVGRSERPLTPQEAARFQDVLKTIQNATSMVIPKDVVIEFIHSAHDSSEVYLKSLEYYNLIISRSLLVPDMMGLGGSKTSGGSYSIGQKHFDIFLGTISHDRNTLERKINEKIVKPLVLMNYGKDIKCNFIINRPSDENVLEYARMWADAVKASVFPKTQEEIDHFKNSVGFPLGEQVIEEEKPEPIMPPTLPQGQPPLPEDAEVDDEKGDKKEDLFTFTAKTSYEKRVDFEKIKSDFNSFDSSLSTDLKEVARRIYENYIEQISNKGLLTKFVPQRINELKPLYLKDMKTLFKNSYKTLFKSSQKQAEKELFKNREVKMAADDFLPEELLDLLDAESFAIVGDYANNITKKARAILVDAIKYEISPAQTLELLREEMAGATETWINAVIRTKTTEIYNAARKNYWDNDEFAKEIVTAYQFSAIMDSRVSDICSSLHGKVYDKNDPELQRIMPPLHFNCRSLIVPVTIYDEYTVSKIPSLETVQNRGGGLKSFGVKNG
jgi:SPP1 gp7 family putative phage head morphogenesis protein